MDVENKYYNAKQMKVDNPEEAIDEFLGVPALEPEKGDWGFKGLKQAIKLEFKLDRYDKVSFALWCVGVSLLMGSTGRRALRRAVDLRQVCCHS